MYHRRKLLIVTGGEGMQRLLVLLIAVLMASCGGSDQTAATNANLTPVQSALTTHSSSARVLVPSDYRDLVQQIYIAYFGRPADAAGLEYFQDQLQKAAAPTTLPALIRAYDTNPGVKVILDSFSISAESAALYPTDNGSFITSVYTNLFNRTPDEGGRAYWAQLIDARILTRTSAAVSIMAGAASSDLDIIKNKVNVSVQFTRSLNTDEKVKAYSGLAANAVARSMLASISQVSEPAIFETKISQAIVSITVAVSTNASPTITSYSPTTATTGQLTTFTFYGKNLDGGVTATFDGCLGIVQIPGATSTTVQFSCTPLLSGSTKWVIKSKNSGQMIGSFSVGVASAPQISGPKQCWVNGYYRASGTYVRGYWRSC